jgi:hypothetical protein
MMLAEPRAITTLVTAALEAMDVPDVIGGSLASALRGGVRATMDADLVADIHQEHAPVKAREQV